MRSSILSILFAAGLAAQVPTLPPLRKQAEIQQEWLRLRLERNLPALMRKHHAQMWIVACREYAEDPAFFSLVSPTVFAARRTTIYVFFDPGPEQNIERLALGGDSNGGLYTVYRDPDAANREMWRQDKNMLVLKLWSDSHQRTPIDLFVYEPFDFKAEFAQAVRMEVASGLAAPFVTRKTLMEMKRVAGRPQDLTDIAALEKLQRMSENSGHDAI